MSSRLLLPVALILILVAAGLWFATRPSPEPPTPSGVEARELRESQERVCGPTLDTDECERGWYAWLAERER